MSSQQDILGFFPPVVNVQLNEAATFQYLGVKTQDTHFYTYSYKMFHTVVFPLDYLKQLQLLNISSLAQEALQTDQFQIKDSLNKGLCYSKLFIAYCGLSLSRTTNDQRGHRSTHYSLKHKYLYEKESKRSSIKLLLRQKQRW